MTAILLDLGRVEYGRALSIQRRLAELRAAERTPDVLILLEHDHVITLGRKTTPENFRSQDVPVFEVERGGDATYHGPGQLVGYPIVKLSDHDVRRHVMTIEAALISALKRFDVAGEIREGHPGVWVGGQKLASIGVAISNWVTYHGFALNVSTDMSYFNLIRPCGLNPETMTSMQVLTGKRTDIQEVKAAVAEEYSSAVGETFASQGATKVLELVNVN